MKKKITRSDLNALASKFDALTELEKYKGGDWYYDSNGSFMGQYGPGNNVRIVNGYEASLLINTTGCTSELDGFGDLFSASTNIAVKNNIFCSFLPNCSSVVINASSDPLIDIVSGKEGVAYTKSSNGVITVTYDALHGRFDNYYDFQSYE